MSERSESSQPIEDDVTVDFGVKFAQSELFSKIFQEGMGLVEATASYLDGPGRDDSRILDRNVAMAYATESMRLTTRLMQLASWLLLQRAVKDGEMTSQEAQDEKYRINLAEGAASTRPDVLDELPPALNDLLVRGQRLYERIIHLDDMLGRSETIAAASDNPLADERMKLSAAFATDDTRE